MGREQEGLRLLPRQSRLCPGSAGKMPGGLLLWLPLVVVLCASLPGTASGPNPHLCEGYAGPDGRYHPGFQCPRLSDPAGHRFCCRRGPRALKSCCSRQALAGLNASGPGALRRPPGLPFAALYGLLILLLMAADLAHFCWSRRCRLGHLLPRACRPPCGRRAPPS